MMSYSEYAPHYDNLCDINPAYQNMQALFRDFLSQVELPENPMICDLGAGTGNFVCATLDCVPSAHVTHLDCCPEMNAFATQKYVSRGLDVTVVESYMQNWDFEKESLDLVLCVNALNNAPPVLPMLRKIESWIKPGGSLFLIDFGRQIKIVDWTWYLVKHSLKNEGLRKTVQSIVNTRKAFSSNRAGSEDQVAGRLWTHTTGELVDSVDNAGLKPIRVETCYREYADLIIAKKMTDTEEAASLSTDYRAMAV